MPENFLYESEITSSSPGLVHDSGMGGLSQSTAYGMGLSPKNEGSGSSLELDHFPDYVASVGHEMSSLEPDWSVGESTGPMLHQTGPAVMDESVTSDDLTGLADGEAVLLNIGSSPNSRQQVSGRLDFSDYFNPTRLYAFKDDYLITASANTSIQINLDSFDFDAYLQVVNPYTGRVLGFDDDGGSGTNAQLTFTAQAGGEYLIRATSYSSYEVGAYSLTAYLGSGNEPEPPNPPSEFSQASGYGLVDAAAAVAEAIGRSQFDNVPDIGGNQWNNDLINAPEVWAQGYTGEGITVAVIDSGVDINHEDLRDNIWANVDEILGDGIDNDNNGFVDDRFGWNFGTGQNNNDVRPGTMDPGQSHGTHVAGTIAAMNNGFGMTGVAHGSNIMAIRMGDVSNNRFVNGGSLAQGIRYAVDNGARVINMSLGWNDESGAVQDALAYAAERNVITVSAAGNQGNPSPGQPGRYATDYGVVVGAVDSQSNLADFSNRAGTDSRMQYVTAPGVDIYSTVSNSLRYDSDDGTSMASPHVAGVVALMLSANANLTHSDVRSILTGTTASSTGQGLFDWADPDAETDVSPEYPPDLIGPSALADAFGSTSSQFSWLEASPQTKLAEAVAPSPSDPAQDLLSDWQLTTLAARVVYASEAQPIKLTEELVLPLLADWLADDAMLAIA